MVYLLGGGFDFFYFHPYLGKIPLLTSIFQMGWNHQQDLPTFTSTIRLSHSSTCVGYKESHLNPRGPGSIMEKLFNEAPGLIYEVSGRFRSEVDVWNAVNSPVEGGEGSWNPIIYIWFQHHPTGDCLGF